MAVFAEITVDFFLNSVIITVNETISAEVKQMSPYMDDVREDIAKGDEFVSQFIEIFKQVVEYIKKILALFNKE